MKIAFLNISQGVAERGSEVFVSEISRRLGNNHEVDVVGGGKARVGTRWPIVWRAFLDPHGITILLFTLRNVGRIWRKKYDVVVALNGGWQVSIVRLVTLLYGGKMVVSGQSGKGWDDRNNLWAFPNVFIALTEENKRWARRACPWVRVELIHNGVDLEEFDVYGEKLEIDLPKPVVLCVGALSPEKRIELVIEAVSRMKKASLLVVGEGELREGLKAMGKRLLGERFELRAFSHKEMPKVYRSGDVFVLLPRKSEAFGIVYVEAMACGLGVVACDDDSRREIIGKAGVLVKRIDNPEFTARAIEKALLIKRAEISRRQAEKFGWDEIALKYEELFKSILK